MNKASIEEAIKKRYPEAVALIVCKDKNNKINITPIGWFTLCSSEPRCWAICLYKKHYSHKVISETKEFVLCLPSHKQKNDILYCGSVHGHNVDKLKNCRLKTIPSKIINTPILEGSVAAYECRVIKSIITGDHTIFIGKIVESYTSKEKDKVYNHGDHNLFSLNTE